MAFIPETLPQVVIARAVRRNSSPQQGEAAKVLAEKVIAQSKINILKEMRFVTTMAFRIMFTEPIVTFLGLFNGFAYGLLFLYLDGIFDVFVVNNNLSYVISKQHTHTHFQLTIN
jgi:hypothetical protein